jgi:hypothetical protein
VKAYVTDGVVLLKWILKLFVIACFVKIIVLYFLIAARRNNWPPLPEKCCFQPCFYQDINVDIPLEFQKIVRLLYYLWMCKSVFHIIMSILKFDMYHFV